jgi:hypothetical protein
MRPISFHRAMSLRFHARVGWKPLIRATAAIATVAIAGALASGCSASIGKNLCDLNIQNPHQSSGSPRYMDAKITFTCNAVVTNATVKIKMQKRTASGTWVDVPNSTNTLSKNTIQKGQKITLMTGGSLLCSAGTYLAVGAERAHLRASPMTNHGRLATRLP